MARQLIIPNSQRDQNAQLLQQLGIAVQGFMQQKRANEKSALEKEEIEDARSRRELGRTIMKGIGETEKAPLETFSDLQQPSPMVPKEGPMRSPEQLRQFKQERIDELVAKYRREMQGDPVIGKDIGLERGLKTARRGGAGSRIIQTDQGFVRASEAPGGPTEQLKLDGKVLQPKFAPSVGTAGDFVINKRTGEKMWEIPKTRSEKIKDDQNSRGWAELSIDKEKLGLQKNPGWQKVDEAFAKDYNRLIGQGKIADAIKIVEQVDFVKENLEEAIASGENITGPLISLLPETALKRINPQATNVRELLEEVVQRNLREVLGAQFTQKEGEKLIARAYNPALDESVNAQRVGRLLASVQSALNAKLEAIAYFEENQTMRGYKSAALKNSISKLKNMKFGNDENLMPDSEVDSIGKEWGF